MDPLHLSIALGPVSIYLLVLGWINLRRKPLVTSGIRDSAALTIAIAGFAIVGPLNLFLPEAASYRFGPFVWMLLLSLYGLFATLILLLLRPRIIIYNVGADQLRPILADIAREFDQECHWMGDALQLPRHNVHLHIESNSSMCNTLLVSSGNKQDYAAWRKLELALRRELDGFRAAPNPRGFGLIAFSASILILISIAVIGSHQSVAQALVDLLRLHY